MLIRVLLAIDKPTLQKDLQTLLSQQDIIVDVMRKQSKLLEHISRENWDMIIISQSRIPNPVFDTIKLLQQLPDSPGIVVFSSKEDPEERAQFLAAGCEAVLYSGLSKESLKDVLDTILTKRNAFQQKTLTAIRLLAQPRLTDFVSTSRAMQTFMRVASRVVKADIPLLILGETGVGKERLARAIHAEGLRSAGPFITVNCGALPETLLESELFGHEEGAFTGAVRSRRGWFELAHRGTIFLDEIGELANHLQVKLLGVLQDHEIQRIGSEKSFKVDVRVMAATNRDLEEEIESRHFRKDLYYRLSVMTLKIPPLRDRIEDIPVLVESYINYLRPRIGCEVFEITDEAKEALQYYSWPGNVRELINVIERAMLLCNDGVITLADLPTNISGKSEPTKMQTRPLVNIQGDGDLQEEWLQKTLQEARSEVLEKFERTYLSGLLRLTNGRVGEAAKKAGIQSRSLFDKMKRLGLRKEDFKPRKSQGM
jgi:DNA-binding NtrC family response regulator